MSKKSKIVIILYNRLFDPLVQSNLWLFINEYLSQGIDAYEFHLVSFESSGHPLTSSEIAQVNMWCSKGLSWTPIEWHQGTRFSHKLFEMIFLFWKVFKLRLSGYRYIISYGSISSAMSCLCAIALRMKVLIHTYEPHSEYMRDSGVWSSFSWHFLVLNLLERLCASVACVIISGTGYMERRISKMLWVTASFFLIPSVANSQKFHFDENIRKKTRLSLGLSDGTPLMLYAGKFGGYYYAEETARMFRSLYEVCSSLHFLIITPQPVDEVASLFCFEDFPSSAFTILNCDYRHIEKYYFAADFGVVAIRNGPSKKYCSSIKVGEYLCAGLPYLVPAGVSGDCKLAQERQVGVILEDFSESAIKSAWPEILKFLAMNPNQRRELCRCAGEEFRSFESMRPVFQAAIAALTR